MRLRPNVGKLLLREGAALREPTAIDDPMDYSNGGKLFRYLKGSLRKISNLENCANWTQQILLRILKIISMARSGL